MSAGCPNRVMKSRKESKQKGRWKTGLVFRRVFTAFKNKIGAEMEKLN